MENINTYIKDKISDVSKNVYVVPDIPEKKLNNVAKSMDLADNINSIIAIYDNTVMGSAKDGLAFTGEKIVYKEMFEKPVQTTFTDLESVDYIKNVEVDDKGKEKSEEFISLTLKDGNEIKIKSLLNCDYKLLAEILDGTTKNFDSFEEENQLLTLAEMAEELKVAYVKIVINMAFSDDGVVDEKEFAEILLLMTRLDLTTESRFELRSYMTSPEEQTSVADLLKIIDDKSASSHNKSIKISLVKDLINTYMSVNNGIYEKFDFLEQHKDLFGVSEDEIELAIDAIKLDFKMINSDFTDDAIIKGMKELTSKASAVGVPLAAVYLSGSVIGMSAAGLTSGLATLGLGGALGFSSMATGIGVAVLIGLGAYKGVRHLTGANELDKVKRRELMLNEVIKQTQSTLSLLIEDLNYITMRFNEAVKTHSLQDAKIQKLMQMMTALTGAADVLNKKSNSTQNSRIKLSCPQELDHEKLKSLTREATKKDIYSHVMSFYEEKTVVKQKDDQDVKVEVLMLKEDIPTAKLEKLSKIFDTIGYFKAANVLKSKVGGLFSK